jgi:hypothetical protein
VGLQVLEQAEIKPQISFDLHKGTGSASLIDPAGSN